MTWNSYLTRRSRSTISSKFIRLLVVTSIGFFFLFLASNPRLFHRNSSLRDHNKVLETIHLNENNTFISKESIIVKNLVLWSSDFHISPIADIKSLLQMHFDSSIRIIDKSLSGHCVLMGTCARDLHIIQKDNGIDLNPCPNSLKKAFYDYYSQDEEFLSADAILCNHAISMCELFMPFNKPMILIASTRYEIGRYDVHRWELWNRNLYRMSLKSYNYIGANNLYDLEYMKYFTNLTSIKLMKNACVYITDRYRPTRNEILILPSRTVDYHVFNEFKYHFNANQSLKDHHNLEIAHVRELYPSHHEYSWIVQHKAGILLPYQVSFMSFFEFYRMGLPMFIPSVALLAQFHSKYSMLCERTWDLVFKKPKSKSNIDRHPNSSSTLNLDPNNESSMETLMQWLPLSDFYQWPHLVVFDSWEDLFEKLLIVNLEEISKNMLKHNEKEEKQIIREWNEILLKINDRKKQIVHSVLPVDINDALEQSYGYQLDLSHCYHESY